MHLCCDLFFDDIVDQVSEFFGSNLFKVLLGKFVTDCIPDELPIRLLGEDHLHEFFHCHVTDFLALIYEGYLPCELLIDRIKCLQARFELIAHLLKVLVEDVASLLVHTFCWGEECHVNVRWGLLLAMSELWDF
jgi:hypothetical protein